MNHSPNLAHLIQDEVMLGAYLCIGCRSVKTLWRAGALPIDEFFCDDCVGMGRDVMYRQRKEREAARKKAV